MVMASLIAIYYAMGIKEYILFGALTYLATSFVLRGTLAIQHRRGMKLVRQGNFNDAIPHFKNSYDFFSQHKWIDNYRYLALLSSSLMSYSEMALCNTAFCYGQIGDRQQAVYYYEQALQEYPDSGLAKAGLAMLKAV
ncbi:tetratricopeptide repeat protein [Hymenobacter rubripertinctus]|uniref:Tetratricopeptide repeat protein n=2 Tax=Hymenobacter rubripertinctus TaxID=2029981 RepID=A0A418QU66_9BACT|nr:tetratricopeptide repeat protein [Hymenobacter rubripertinctus]